ncbi:hypothetical protein [Nonomuraea zeae]|uniref:Secreted protein n=1 Tax=Nonomuraea zeae TaxID=1642303 RepID=A0A5S4GTG7_9ACTN|nr:hypothetical protein [Nonomuraea zeae]TMR36238.1 hypothetical protein ETD85_11575 [Nonomuraea zeae]
MNRSSAVLLILGTVLSSVLVLGGAQAALGVSAAPAHTLAQDPAPEPTATEPTTPEPTTPEPTTPEPTAPEGDGQSQTQQPLGQALAAIPDACTAYGCYTGDGWGSGFGRWVADGDKMWVCDRSADGWSIVVVTDIGTSAKPNKWHTSGAGKCTERSFGDVAEGQSIAFYTCLGDYSDSYILPGSCGPVVSGTT